jgi:hypothetical protein
MSYRRLADEPTLRTHRPVLTDAARPTFDVAAPTRRPGPTVPVAGEHPLTLCDKQELTI